MTGPRSPRAVRLMTRIAASLTVIVGVGVLGAYVAAWFVAGALTAANPVTDTYPLIVRSVIEDTGHPASPRWPEAITMSNGTGAAEPGVFRLSWFGGDGLVGPVLSRTNTAVTRAFRAVHGLPRPGEAVGLEPGRYTGTPGTALGLDYQNVLVASALGPLPAWYTPAPPGDDQTTWVLLVHGLDGSRSDTLQGVRQWHRLGLSTLAVTYRNDPGAATTADDRSHLGLTEWQDLDPAIEYALAHGARSVVLDGFSLGGTLAVECAQRCATRQAVRGLVLDSPLLDWHDTLALSASHNHLPALAADVVCQALSLRIGNVCGNINLHSLAAGLHVPCLVVQGTADRIVPPADALAFARLDPEHVSLLAIPGADHVSGFDVAPRAYARALTHLCRAVTTGHKCP